MLSIEVIFELGKGVFLRAFGFRGFSQFAATVALCSLMACMPFVFGLGGGFLLDDLANIVQNRMLHIPSVPSVDDLLYAAYSFEPGNSSRPLAMLSFALDFWRAGLDPEAFKVTNLIIHGLTTFALSFLVRQLLLMAGWELHKASVSALLMALFWAIHPLQVSSVLYVVQRMQTLGTLFLVLALLSYLKMRELQILGTRARLFGVLALLFWALAFASKEDSVMLPAYALVLELTVLRFRAASKTLVSVLRLGYAIVVVVALLLYLLVVVPHYWYWQDYPGRDFSTTERLLTQGRVLVMYLGQIVLPLPSSLKFFYDDLNVSRGLLEPFETFLALIFLVGTVFWAWRWRNSRPVFSLGVLLFFSGHFMTSNVIGLELAFEHRNHFPLIGAVLALGDLFAVFFDHAEGGRALGASLIFLLLFAAGLMCITRAEVWGDSLRLAKHGVANAPYSERAWAFLCGAYFERSGQKSESSELDLAIETCQKGAAQLPHSALLMNNVVIYKTLKGTVTEEDWKLFLVRLRQVNMTVQNKGILWVTLSNAERRRYNNEDAVLETIEIITGKATLHSAEYLRVAAYIFNETSQPTKAFPYLERAIEQARPGDPAIRKMLGELNEAGRGDWVERLEKIMISGATGHH